MEICDYAVLSCIIWLHTFMPNDCILEATSFPILPSPTIPSTLPYSSAPMNCKISNKTMTPSTRPKIAQIQASHRISDDWLNNGGDHATVIALCGNNHSNSTQGQTKNLCLPFSDPSSLVSLTLQLEAHFWKQNGSYSTSNQLKRLSMLT